MKKILAIALVAAIFLAAPAAQAREKGGPVGGIVGCCLGIRAAADWNEGKDISLCEWLNLVGVGAIWAAIEGWSGTTRSELHEKQPAYF